MMCRTHLAGYAAKSTLELWKNKKKKKKKKRKKGESLIYWVVPEPIADPGSTSASMAKWASDASYWLPNSSFTPSI